MSKKNLEVLDYYGLKIIYDKNDKIASDPYTSIYFGSIYENDVKKDDVVIKIVKDNLTELGQISNELSVLRRIENLDIAKYVPKKYSFLINDNERILVIERFGPSLEEIFKMYGKLSSTTCLSILYQGIKILQALNEAGFVHNDIKLGNLCIGLKDPQHLKLIDFGISWVFPEEPSYVQTHHSINGTPYYVSPEIYYGKNVIPVSRKHDLQSLLYVILELANGSLKWKEIILEDVPENKMNMKRKKIADLKETFIVSEIYKIEEVKFRNFLLSYYNIVWNIPLYSQPPYKKILDKIKKFPGFLKNIHIIPNQYFGKVKRRYF
jgi:serine/threonine protein kinase